MTCDENPLITYLNVAYRQIHADLEARMIAAGRRPAPGAQIEYEFGLDTITATIVTEIDPEATHE